MKTCFSLFTGCGGADVGMLTAGYDSIGGVEYHKPAVQIYNLNHEVKITPQNLLEVSNIPSVDLLWISPPCPSYSQANPKRGETKNDLDLARKIATLIRVSRPSNIALENVRGYHKSQSLSIILTTLHKLCYKVDLQMLKAEDYGNPSHRERFILRASFQTLEPIFGVAQQSGWFKAYLGLNHGLALSKLTDKQLETLEMSSYNTHNTPLLMERCGYYNTPKVWTKDRLAPTIKAHSHHDGKGSYRVAYNILEGGVCYTADTQCLAAWQSFPKTYQWGIDRGEAGRSIGNAVPPCLAKAVAESFN